ncbi:MAG TPA: hypothetical protein VF458_24225 [Ktedonobacteraceae bacterium]
MPATSTAGDLKRYLERPDHSVVVTLPDTSERLLRDNEAVPMEATDITVVPQFRYGA